MLSAGPESQLYAANADEAVCTDQTGLQLVSLAIRTSSPRFLDRHRQLLLLG